MSTGVVGLGEGGVSMYGWSGVGMPMSIDG